MAIIRQDYGSIGGGNLNPTLVNKYALISNQTSTVTLDLTKHYIMTAQYMNTSYNYDGGWYIDKGVISEIYPNSSLGEATISGNTLTIKGTNIYAQTRFILIQLD